ncbi:MAG TPA: amidohydrolase family protein [Gemmatimonadota bacterium]|nr:amidohydrolase family protein [Gemmatimonadota bacterium]
MPVPVRPLSVPVAAIALLLVLAVLPAVAQDAPALDLAIVNVRVVDVAAGAALEGRTVLVRDGEIVDIRPARPGDDSLAAATLDGAGGWLIPGLWDMHAHLRASGLPAWIGTDWMMPLLLAHGVTGARDMASDCDDPGQGPVCLAEMRDWQERIARGDLMGPRIVALSSFPLNPPWDYEITEEQVGQVVGKLAERGVTHLKIYDRLAPEALDWILDAAAERGIAAWGHVPLRMTAAEASDAGFRSIEHARDFLFDCYPGSAAFRATTRSNVAPVEEMRAMVERHDPAVCEAEFRALVRNGTAYVPTHVTRRMEAFAGDSAFRHDPRVRTVPAWVLESWKEDADRVVARDSTPEGRAAYRAFYEKGLEITGAAHAAGVRVLVGTDGGDSFAFPGSGLHDELAELVKAGLTPAEALRAATSSPAEFLGLAERHGTVEVGKRADLVLLHGNPLDDIENVRRIRAVVFRGETLDRARLDGLLRQAAAAAARPLDAESPAAH